MEVLHRGIKPEDIWYKGTCYTCSTQVRFQRKEAINEAEFAQGKDRALKVKCPVCDKEISTDTKYVAPSSTSYWDR